MLDCFIRLASRLTSFGLCVCCLLVWGSWTDVHWPSYQNKEIKRQKEKQGKEALLPGWIDDASSTPGWTG